MKKIRRLALAEFAFALAAFGSGAFAAGIPEPPVLFYGEVRNTLGGLDVRVTSGTLVWTLVPSDGGPQVIGTTQLTNINDQFSYLLPIPCEAQPPGITASVDALRLVSPPVGYSLGNVTLNGQPAYLKLPSQSPLIMASTNRGRISRVDLTLQVGEVDTDGDGIPDAWENRFGLDPSNAADASLDPDLDGMSNLREYLAGTDPNDAQSAFAFITIQPDVAGGVRVEWSSASNRVYTLQRSESLVSGFVDIKMDLVSTPPKNSHRDATATGLGPYFYRLRIQEDPLPIFDGDGNGLADAWEQLYFGRVRIDPTADPDGDGVSNAAEQSAGTSPIDGSSVLRFVRVIQKSSGGIAVEWSSVVNKTYTLLWSADPAAGFDVLASGIPATPPVNTFIDPDLFTTGFYRVLLEP